MPIVRLLQEGAFSPDQILIMTAAYDMACQELNLVDRSDPLMELVASKIIELAQNGERDPTRIKERALAELKGGR